MYYYNARYYDPQLGTFLTPDIFIQNLYDPQSLNRYAYCRNNPIIYADPDGHFWFIIVGMIVGAAMGGTHGDVFNPNAWANFDGWGAISGAVVGGISGGMLEVGLGALGVTQSAIAFSGEATLASIGVAGLGYAVDSFCKANDISMDVNASVSASDVHMSNYINSRPNNGMSYFDPSGIDANKVLMTLAVNTAQIVSSYLIYDDSDGEISMYGLRSIKLDDSANLGSWPASNNADSKSKGKWPEGTYNIDKYKPYPSSIVKPYGNIMFNVPGRKYMGVHGGRGNNYTWWTKGCIRVTDTNIQSIIQLHNQFPLGFIKVQK